METTKAPLPSEQKSEEIEDIKKIEYKHVSEYNCDLCDEAYDTETEIPFHIKKCHKLEIMKSEKHKCWICLKLFDSNKEAIFHLKACHLYSSPNSRRIERETFICDHCAQIFFNKNHLINHIIFYHMDKDHPRTSKTTCHICLIPKTSQYIWHHCRGHEVLSLSCCAICFKKCKNLKALEAHQETHTHYLNCDMCGFATKKQRTFIEHVYNHDRKSENLEENQDDTIMLQRMFRPEGDMCQWTISQISHLTGIKLPNGIKICILCREICTTREEMRQHLLDHKLLSTLENIKKYHICKCGQEFPSNILLRHHKLQEEKKARESPEARTIVIYESSEQTSDV